MFVYLFTQRKKTHFISTALIFHLEGVVIQQDVPALYLLVFVLQAVVPVLQTLSFGLDAQLTAS